MSLLNIGTLQTSNDWGTEVHLVDDIDQTLSNGIASNDTAENVDEDGRDLGVAGDELEGGADSSRGSTTTDVKEVSGSTAVKLDDIHSSHGKTGTIDYM